VLEAIPVFGQAWLIARAVKMNLNLPIFDVENMNFIRKSTAGKNFL